ncbi:MAG: hypothetical protein NUV49_02165 [Patescibacteria group bacterium]|nr:hypothetical protein [Patescibacteria group bacterium]
MIGKGRDNALLDIERRDGEIVVLRAPGIILHKDGSVVSTGQFMVPKGARGRVITIKEPYTDGHTTDVVVCIFEGHEGPVRMKPGEIISEDPSPKSIQ